MHFQLLEPLSIEFKYFVTIFCQSRAKGLNKPIPMMNRPNSSLILTFTLALLSGRIGSIQAGTQTVTNAADSGPGTLRLAILDANAYASPDLVAIEFNIPGGGCTPSRL